MTIDQETKERTMATEAELAMLTPAEREAILEADDETDQPKDGELDEEKEADEEGAEGSSGDETTAKPAADDQDGKDGDAPAEAAADEVKATPVVADPAKDVVTVGKGYVQLDVGDARNLDAELADLRKRFEEGEVSQSDYDAGLMDIGAARAAAQVTQQLNQKFAEQEWNQAQEDFYAAHSRFNSPAMRAALGNAVERVEAESGDQKLRSSVLLQKAAALVDQELGAVFGQTAQESKPTAKDGPKPKAPVRTEEAARQRAASASPRTLADVPAAQENETGKNDKFESIDRLTGLEYENAIARLSPSEREAFEALQ